MGFRPVIDEVKVMDARIYQARPMGLPAVLAARRLREAIRRGG
jgi:acyl CoA:acetate/3-ketoacid CoA transferase